MVSKVEFETIDTRSLELESSISHMTIIFEVRTIYRLRVNFLHFLFRHIDRACRCAYNEKKEKYYIYGSEFLGAQ